MSARRRDPSEQTDMVKAAMIHHMNVPIDDIDRARDFYGRVLGLPESGRRTSVARAAGR